MLATCKENTIPAVLLLLPPRLFSEYRQNKDTHIKLLLMQNCIENEFIIAKNNYKVLVSAKRSQCGW